MENLTEIKRHSFEICKQLCLLGQICIFIPKKSLKYLSNRQQKDLMSKCKVFLFLSYYESFELPSLERLSTKVKILQQAQSLCLKFMETWQITSILMIIYSKKILSNEKSTNCFCIEDELK